MDNQFYQLSISQLTTLLAQERKKFLKALDYNSPPSVLEEIMETIKIIEQEIIRKEDKANNNNQQVA